ncbi:MAG: amino acid adenylation domain-containing protein, partial [Gammaproteobacteria bacterium]|nr:amino acid adenylation domain-containing protein [Gammaproteobacteria bacterium]
QQTYVAPTTELEKQLAQIWQDVLGVEQVGLNDNFFELGGDSIVSIQLVSRARQAGLQFSPKDVFQHQMLSGLARVAKHSDETKTKAEQGLITGGISLIPIQQEFFEGDIPHQHQWNQSVLLKLHQTMDSVLLSYALAQLVTHHDALRLNYSQQENGNWQALFNMRTDVSADMLWLRDVTNETELTAIANEAQRSLNLINAPLMRVVLFTLPEGEQRLLIVIHHLVVDGVSWRILLEDLQTVYKQLQLNQTIVLPEKTSSIKDWSTKLVEYAQAPTLLAELDYWQAELTHVRELPRDNVQGSQQNKYAKTVTTQLDKNLTEQLLKQAPSAYRTQINDLLLTALSQVICDWTGEGSTLIALEGHGREELFNDIDLTRTVGWFTSMFPVKLTPASTLDSAIKAVKEQLRAIPNKGLGYGVLRYLSDADTQQQMKALPKARITFNYLGQFDGSFNEDNGALFSPAQGNGGASISDEAPLDNWISINGQVYNGELALSWSFSGEVYHTSTIQVLADKYTKALEAIVNHCLAEENYGLTPSDFPLTNLSQSQIDNLPVPVEQIADIYPLSPMQQGMLFHSLNEPEAGAYLNQMRVDVSGLDVERFRQAWQTMLERHDILRAGFIWEGVDEPVQVIYRQVKIDLQVHDWRNRKTILEKGNESLLGHELSNLGDVLLQEGFELSQAPLLRLDLVRLSEGHYHLIYTNHHILTDGWSSSQLIGEVLQSYAGQDLQPVQGRYRDYLAWLQVQDKDKSEQFWLKQLANLEEPTLLTRAIKSSPQNIEVGREWGEHQQALSIDDTQRLTEFAKEQKVTVNTVLQAAWLLLLQRYTSQDTVTFGATVAGRPADVVGIEQQLGLFINTLPVVATIYPTETVGDYLRRIQNQNLDLREYEHTPLYDVQRWAGQGGSALFDSILVFENYPISEALQQGSPQGLVFGEVGNHEQTNYGLTLAIGLGKSLSITTSYNRCQFSDGVVEQLMQQLTYLLKSFTKEPEQKVSGLSLLNQEEQQHIIEDWNDTAVSYDTEVCIHQLFEQQAKINPANTALVFEDKQLSYQTLNQKANQLAHKLRAQGVGPDVLVGIAVERSLEMVVGLLAILKAGGAYVPLDPDYPQERLAYMVEASGIKLLLSQSHIEQQLAIPNSIEVVLLDNILTEDALSDYSTDNLLNHNNSSNLAYVIYTSGSTGKPKGVAIAHASTCALIHWAQTIYSQDDLQGVLASTSVCFDLSVWEIFVPLSAGGYAVIVDNILALQAAPARDRVCLINTVPSAITSLLQAKHIPSSVRIVNLAGEALKQSLVEELYVTGIEKVYDLYGPSEDTTYSTFTRRISNGHANIGKPIDNSRTYILDDNLQPVPQGVVSELYVGGAGLSRGYYKRADLTAERFIADPFNESGGRLYRTGDLARYQADGTIEYVGRIDHQVKIRGFRIELGEIESQLQSNDAIRDAVVLAQEGNGGQQLVAYVIPNDSGLIETDNETQNSFRADIKNQLQQALPEYMVPAHMLLLEQFPLTPNGKLDRKALPKADASQLQQTYVAPSTELEKQLAQIWQEVLGVEQVGLSDNFFALGGHSLLATQVIAKAQLKLRGDFPFSLLFEVNTLQEYASSLMTYINTDLDQDLDEMHDLLAELQEEVE